jgi:peptidoglycan/xylan/chitin deacetylase (PgdA/CDA1 family)
LAQYGVRGTFFLTGKFSEANPDLTRQIASAGHEIFNHTYSHPDLATVSDDTIAAELQREENINLSLTGKSTKPYFRPPYGSRNAHILDVAWAQGYRSVYWTVDALDWQTTATDSFVYNRVISNLSNGMIVLMHIGDDITGRILGSLFADIKSRGYSIVSLTQGL